MQARLNRSRIVKVLKVKSAAILATLPDGYFQSYKIGFLIYLNRERAVNPKRITQRFYKINCWDNETKIYGINNLDYLPSKIHLKKVQRPDYNFLWRFLWQLWSYQKAGKLSSLYIYTHCIGVKHNIINLYAWLHCAAWLLTCILYFLSQIFFNWS